MNRLSDLIEMDERPDRLLHFTDAKGLRGIIESRILYLMHARSSSDPEELQHGINLAWLAICKRPDRLEFEEVLMGLQVACSLIAFSGQAATHNPQPWHRSAFVANACR